MLWSYGCGVCRVLVCPWDDVRSFIIIIIIIAYIPTEVQCIIASRCEDN